MTDFKFKTVPYAHQLATFERSRDLDAFAILFEQRVGKTKVALDTAAYSFLRGRIDALLIVSPAGVHRNWVVNEIPTHLADETNPLVVLWRSGKMASKRAEAAWAELLAHPGLAVLAVNVDALITPLFRQRAVAFLKQRKVMTVVDESLDISSPSAKRTKNALKIGARSVMRRILDGTPADASPLGLFSQFQFLKPGALGYTSYTAFKNRYAEWEERDAGEHDRKCLDCVMKGKSSEGCSRCGGTGYIGRHTFQELKRYTNLDELQERVAAISSRVTRAQCADLPPKIYQKRYFDLSSIQRRAYDELRESFITELRSGELVTAAMVLTRYLRLQQIASNFVGIGATVSICAACQGDGCEACNEVGFIASGRVETTVVDPDADPRLAATLAEIARLPAQGIVWGKFRHDLAALSTALRDRGEDFVQYHGGVSPEDRGRAIAAFQAGDARVFVGNPRAGGRGVDLAAANWVIYHSHDWPLRWRRQSEDRAQSLKKRDAVLYVDVVASETVDEKILAVLREGRNLAELVMGDPRGDWL